MPAPQSSKKTKAQFHWDDPLLLNQQLTDEERMVRDAAHAYCQDQLQPRILDAFRHEKRTPEFFAKWARSAYSARRYRNSTAAPD